MTEPTELLPCPFCGCAPTTIERPDNIDGTQFFYAIACYCGRHSACAHKMAVRKTPEIAKADAIAAWNTRTPQPTQAQAVAGGEPVGFANAGQLDNIADGYAYLYPKEGPGAHVPLYTAPPPQAVREPLTLEQIERIYERYGGDMVNCTRSIERHHGITKGGQHG